MFSWKHKSKTYFLKKIRTAKPSTLTLEYIKVNIACANQIQITSVYVVEVGLISLLSSES